MQHKGLANGLVSLVRGTRLGYEGAVLNLIKGGTGLKLSGCETKLMGCEI